MRLLARRHFIQSLAGLCTSVGELASRAAEKSRYHGVVHVRQSHDSIDMENGLLRASFRKSGRAIEQNYYAQSPRGGWELLVRSLRPPQPHPADTSPLYSDADVAGECRLLAADALHSARVREETRGSATIILEGTLHGNHIQQRVSLSPEQNFFHFEVTGSIAGNPPRLEYLLSLFEFTGGASPGFTHVPCLKRAADDIIGDRVFEAPAIIVQKQQRLVALVPDLDLLNQEVVYAKGARPIQGKRGFRIQEDPGRITMPSILDLDLKSGLSSDPVFAFGLADYITEQHVFWRHENKQGAMARQLSQGNLRYGFDLFLNADALLERGFQIASHHLWKRYGTRYFHQPRPQVMPLAEYAKVCYPAAFTYKGDNKQDTKRYSEERAYDADESGPLPTWLEFDLDGKPAGGIRSTATQWYYDIQFSPWWNNARDAMGMYWWGRRGDRALVDKARHIVNLVLAAPQQRGIFPSVYRYNEKRWIGCYWKFPEDFNPNWRFPGEWKPEALPHFWAMSSDFYQPAAASKTGVYLLRYIRHCEDDPRIVPYLRNYADFLLEHVDPSGCIPAWFTASLEPVRELRFNAEGGIHIWFLAELSRATEEARYLDAATRMANFLSREILPQQRWYDFETFYSCSIKPESFYDAFTGQWPQCTLSMLWAIDGFSALYRLTQSKAHLSAAEAVADYAGLYQAVWQPHFIKTAYAFGGFRSQNSDAEWLDMRQTCFAGALVRLAELTHRRDLYERGVAALRASFAIINHPRLIKNDVFRYPRYPLGIEPENIDHEGVSQVPLRSGFDWGEGGGLAAAAELLGKLGGAYIDFEHHIAVGIDGVTIRHFRREGRRININLENQLAALPFPYEKPYEIELALTGLQSGQYELVLNGGKPEAVRLAPPARLRIEIAPRTTKLLSLASPAAARNSAID